MLSRRQRLSRPDFTLVSKDPAARRAAGPYLSATISSKASGAAIVVSKKVAKTAVGRHLLKRRIRAALAPLLSPAKGVIVYARPGAEKQSFSDISQELASILGETLQTSA